MATEECTTLTSRTSKSEAFEYLMATVLLRSRNSFWSCSQSNHIQSRQRTRRHCHRQTRCYSRSVCILGRRICRYPYSYCCRLSFVCPSGCRLWLLWSRDIHNWFCFSAHCIGSDPTLPLVTTDSVALVLRWGQKRTKTYHWDTSTTFVAHFRPNLWFKQNLCNHWFLIRISVWNDVNRKESLNLSDINVKFYYNLRLMLEIIEAILLIIFIDWNTNSYT